MILKGNFSEIRQGVDELIKAGSLEFLTDEIIVTVFKGDSGLKVEGKDNKYEITYGEKADFFRAISILNGKIGCGENEVGIKEERLLTTSGIMVDCSRNAVLTVDTVKDIIRKISAMGLNMAMLYTEDTYEIEGYPYFGYLRGAYTKEELIEIDRYGLLFGVEMVPCIQTLGHLAAALRWPFANNIRENFHTLLVGEDETYALIRKMIERCRECFTTNKIHIGMDEAPSVGKGAYLEKYGYRDRFELLEMHLKKVIEITVVGKEYDDTFKEAVGICNYIKQKTGVIVLGPAEDYIVKVNDLYHFKINVKYESDRMINDVMNNIFVKYETDKNYKIYISRT